MHDPTRFDPDWERRYETGTAQRYPWDAAVTFIYRNAPRDVARDRVSVLEVGFGTASNLWFAAREGFRVAGIEGSETAVNKALTRFKSEGLSGDLQIGDFTEPFPWPDASFDLMIDRGALTCSDDRGMTAALSEIHRVLKPGGRALITPCADTHSSRAAGETLDNGLTINMRAGSMAGIAGIRFYSRAEIERLLDASRWTVRSIQKMETTELLGDAQNVHAEFRIIIERRAD